MTLTNDPDDPGLRQIRPDGQQEKYLVLSDEERAKGFVRPLRRSYKHVGIAGPIHPLRELTPEEHQRYDHFGYVKFEAYPEGEESVRGRFWTQARLDKVGVGCGQTTTMGWALAETYARDPAFYGGTFCATCNAPFPVGEVGEFIWTEAGRWSARVGT